MHVLHAGRRILPDKTKAPFYTQISEYMLFGKIPMPVIYAFMFVVFWFISRYEDRRHIYAAGSNERPELSGINTDRIKILAFTLLGLAISVAAIIESSRRVPSTRHHRQHTN